MSLFSRILGIDAAAESRAHERAAAIAESIAETAVARAVEAATQIRAAEARPLREVREADDEWAWRRLFGGDAGRHALPEAFTEKVLRDSAWQFQTDGLAQRILYRCQSIVLEGGIQYTVTFADGFPPEYEQAIRRRLSEFWYGEQADIQNRAAELVLETLMYGEAGIRVSSSPASGRVTLGSVSRLDVTGLDIDPRDRRTLRSVILVADDTAPGATPYARTEGTPLRVLAIDPDPASPSHKHLSGDVIYLRYGSMAAIGRGMPLLQAVVDDLRIAKKYRILATDRMLARLSLFMDTTVEGATEEDVVRMAKANGTAVPAHGYRFYHNEKVTNTFLSAQQEAYEVGAYIKQQTTGIVGAIGLPLSWFGYGDGSTKATSETQQAPASMDMARFKASFYAALERLMYYVADCAILSRYITSKPGEGPLDEIPVTDGDGNALRQIMRECITITVSPIAINLEQRKTLEATTGAMAVIAQDETAAALSGLRHFSPDDRTRLLNWALSADGAEIELEKPDAEAPDAGTPPGVGAAADPFDEAARDAGYDPSLPVGASRAGASRVGTR